MRKQKRRKKRSFKIRCSDYAVVLLLNFVIDSISSIKKDISLSTSSEELSDLIPQKYIFMELAQQLGITMYDEELKSKKSLTLELESTLNRNKEYSKNYLKFLDENLDQKNVVPEKVENNNNVNEDEVF